MKKITSLKKFHYEQILYVALRGKRMAGWFSNVGLYVVSIKDYQWINLCLQNLYNSHYTIIVNILIITRICTIQCRTFTRKNPRLRNLVILYTVKIQSLFIAEMVAGLQCSNLWLRAFKWEFFPFPKGPESVGFFLVISPSVSNHGNMVNSSIQDGKLFLLVTHKFSSELIEGYHHIS